MKITLVVTGRAYHTAAALPRELELPDGSLLSEAIGEVNERLGAEAQLPASCLIAVAGQHLGTVGGFEDRGLRDGDELTLVAPVAGG